MVFVTPTLSKIIFCQQQWNIIIFFKVMPTKHNFSKREVTSSKRNRFGVTSSLIITA
jgi:hypothetical protein